jgi:hypothetical protein
MRMIKELSALRLTVAVVELVAEKGLPPPTTIVERTNDNPPGGDR